MRSLLYAGLAGGVLLTICSVPHAFGWSLQFAPAVAGLDPELVGGLQVGWLFGSFCMAGFGIVATGVARRALKGGPVDRLTAGTIGATLIVFGVWAMFFRSFNPFFFLFIVLGLLVGGMALTLTQGKVS